MLGRGALLAVLAVLLTGSTAFAAGDAAGPAGDLGAVHSQQAQLREQMADNAQQITELNLQIAALQRSIAGLQVRISDERAQIRMLARVIYAQPDTALGYLVESSSLADALTRLADISVAGRRATTTERALLRDLASQRAKQDQLKADLDRQEALQARLAAQFAQLEQKATSLALQAAQPPAPPAPSAIDASQVGPIQDIIRQAFAPQGAYAQQWALRIAKCESNYNPYAVNRSSGAAGLFQFLPSTWAGTPERAASPFDATANSYAAAWLYQKYGPGQWQCR